MMNTNRNNNVRFTERARAITAAKKASARKKRMILSVTALALVVVAAASFVIIGIANNNAKPASDTTVSKSVLAAQADNQPATDAAEVATVTPEQPAWLPAESYTEFVVPATEQTYVPAEAQQKDEDRIDVVNGERVYIDTKRTAPEGSGTPLHFYANGKTSYGFDWNYDADNCNFVLRCDYNFDQQQYDFQFYGVTPGTAHVTVYYNTDDNTQVPVNLTINVDDALNVTQL